MPDTAPQTIDDFTALLAEERFALRHIGPGPAERAAMLRALGAADLDALIARTVPETIRSAAPLDLPAALTEGEILDDLRRYAADNEVKRSLIGLG